MDDLEIIYEELLHIKALSHLSTIVSCLLAEHGWGHFELNALLGLGEEDYSLREKQGCLNSTS